MPFFDYTPNNPAAAYQYAWLLQMNDFPGDPGGRNQVLTNIMGGNSFRTFESDTLAPVSWGYSINNDTLLVWFSGIKIASQFPALANSYLTPATDTRTSLKYLTSPFIAALSIANTLRARGVRQYENLILLGHSMGSLVANAFAIEWPIAGRNPRIDVCTFGGPKSVLLRQETSTITNYARWVVSEDNVPNLPCGPIQAPLIHSALSRVKSEQLRAWRHPCASLGVLGNGEIQPDMVPIAIPITASTILQALQSRQGAFGEGHGIWWYKERLEKAARRYAGPTIVPQPPILAGSVPVIPAPPLRLSPVVVEPAQTPQQAAVRINAFRAAATQNDAQESAIPFPNLPVVVKQDGLYYVQWMGAFICLGPTKKKCRALVRHLSRFLRTYQGVGQSMSGTFAISLASYLKAAADPNSAFKPILNDGGELLDLFGLNFGPIIAP